MSVKHQDQMERIAQASRQIVEAVTPTLEGDIGFVLVVFSLTNGLYVVTGSDINAMAISSRLREMADAVDAGKVLGTVRESFPGPKGGKA